MKSKIFFLDKIPSMEEILLSLSSHKSDKVATNSSLFNEPYVKPLKSPASSFEGKSKATPNLSNSLSYNKRRQILVFYDKKLKSAFIKWKKHPQLFFYELNSGEKTKSLEELPKHITKINSLLPDFDKKRTLFLAAGGGSLLDLVGFLAGVYKRGVDFISLPSTWLAAVDSAHGGKNALNFKGVKNLLGSYHFPQAVFIVKELLKANPKSLEESGYGELLKISLIEGGGLYKKLKTKTPPVDFFPFLKPAVKAKMKIVRQDPFEKKSLRQKLNLGHSIGHILEARHSLSHGHAVMQGLLFSLNWSFHKGFLSGKDFKEIQSLIPDSPKLKPMPEAVFLKYLRQDKKRKLNQKLDFVFIKKPGEVFIESVSEKEILKQAQKQKLIKSS